MTPGGGAHDGPWLSFVIPAHDVEAYVRACLASILDSTARVEVIVVDDGSTDATAAEVGALQASDDRVRLVRNAEPAGPGNARNRGLDLARGRYVWFVDADDWVLPGAVDRVIERLTAGDADALLLDHVRVYPSGRAAASTSRTMLERAPDGCFRLDQWPDLVRVLHTPWNKVLRRELLDDAGIRFSASPVYEDVAFTYRSLLAANRIAVLREPAYAYRTARPGALTRTPGPAHLAWSTEWTTALRAAADADAAVRRALFARMLWHGWEVLGPRNGRRIPRRIRREFFERFAAVYREFHAPDLPRDRTLERGRVSLATVTLARRWARWAAGRAVARLRRGAG